MRDTAWLTKKVYNKELKTFSIQGEDAIVQTIIEEIAILFPSMEQVAGSGNLEFLLDNSTEKHTEETNIERKNQGFIIQSTDTKGLLYGFFKLYQQLALGQSIPAISKLRPSQQLRMINHWDNMDGSIERGYAGESIFFSNNRFRRDFQLVRAYARLLASVGINALSINNVNVHVLETRLILEENLPEIKMINDIFASYGIKTFLSINFASPKKLGGLDTADPLSEDVQQFWQGICRNIYRAIPDFGGFVVKADSEGEPGPFAYGRSHDDGANMLAKALKPYGGKCIWRCFVYDCKQDWRDRSIDRARAAYDHFLPLDGKFDENVSLQIKLGPLDFQVREPISPLFGALRNTNHIIEFQLTQEYTGQQKAIYYQAPVWKEALDFDTQYDYPHSLVKEAIKTNSPNPTQSGVCAVGVVGMDNNWTGHKLMQSNLYAYGRLTWDNDLSSEEIAQEWIGLTFDLSEERQSDLLDILLSSRRTYEQYTAPNGVGFMCRPNHHYGPDIDGYEYDRWGTYHFADRNGIGNDRTIEGTGFVTQYAPAVMDYYNHIDTCPDYSLLWFHHVPYTHQLHNGKTLIQDIYDNHFEGVEKVENYMARWENFSTEVSTEDFENVRQRLIEQHRVAVEWRDQINTYFYRHSGINDEKHRTIYK